MVWISERNLHQVGCIMLQVFLSLVIVSFSSLAFSQSHSSINGARSSFDRNVFFDQSFLGFNNKISLSGSEAPEGFATSWTGSGIRDGFGIELYKFIHLSLLHTSLSEEAKGASTNHFSGNEVMGDLSLNFASPIGNLGFGSGVFASRIDMQQAEKSAKYSGAGRVDHISLNYFLNSAFSIDIRAEQAQGDYHKGSGDIELSKFSSKRTGLGLGFKIWF